MQHSVVDRCVVGRALSRMLLNASPPYFSSSWPTWPCDEMRIDTIFQGTVGPKVSRIKLTPLLRLEFVGCTCEMDIKQLQTRTERVTKATDHSICLVELGDVGLDNLKILSEEEHSLA